MESNWHAISAKEALEKQQTDENRGLQEAEAKRRLTLVGANTLKKKRKKSAAALFFTQFTDLMVVILMAAAVISAFFAEYADAVTILAIIIINAVLGFFQEYRAERALEALKRMTAPEAKVKRDGRITKIAAELLVPGDIVYLDTGDIVPADLRLTETVQMEVNEAALTGESVPVRKDESMICPASAGVGDRRNMAYMATVVSRGKGSGVVVATGMATEMGQIAGIIEEIKDEATPLQKRLEQLGRWLVFFCLLIVAFVVLAGIWRGESVYGMLLTGVSLAVAAIPEGLPAIVTVALAVGVQKMVRQQAIVRALPAVETLGCATVICADKTGTMTQNEMTVKKLYLSGRFIDVGGAGYEPRGAIVYPEDELWRKKNAAGFALAFKTAALCNNAILKKNELRLGGFFRGGSSAAWQIDGDPTEGALLVAAAKGGVWREVLEKRERRVFEAAFDSERKRMSVVYESFEGRFCYCKGAPDVIIDRCASVWSDGRAVPLTEGLRRQILAANDEMAGRALRVLGLAYRELPKRDIYSEREIEEGLTFIGLAGLIDPPRATAKNAVAACRLAGIKTVMITGDHKKTAEAVARELRVLTDPAQRVLTGSELEAMNDFQMKEVVGQTSVYARVSPKHKLRIVRALKENGHVVAMTGDGVNDAPAVKEADIGISMGLSGTDVTKEASALILGNDDFATIVMAVEEGRIIYDNIRKFIRYLLACNIGEVLTMLAATLLAFPLPLLPIQILWMNLVTDGLPAMALGLDPGDPDVMRRPPRSPRESIFAHGLIKRIIVRAVVIMAVVLFIYLFGFFFCGNQLELARTMAFTALVFVQLFYVFDCRSEHYSIFQLGFLTNPFLVGAVLCSMAMQLLVIYVPFFQRIFKTVPLSAGHWAVIIGLALGTTLLQGLRRTVKIRRKRRLLYSKIQAGRLT